MATTCRGALLTLEWRCCPLADTREGPPASWKSPTPARAAWHSPPGPLDCASSSSWSVQTARLQGTWLAQGPEPALTNRLPSPESPATCLEKLGLGTPRASRKTVAAQLFSAPHAPHASSEVATALASEAAVWEKEPEASGALSWYQAAARREREPASSRSCHSGSRMRTTAWRGTRSLAAAVVVAAAAMAQSHADSASSSSWFALTAQLPSTWLIQALEPAKPNSRSVPATSAWLRQ
mmetsp:Transcript_69352/g.166270  ORF Transcript_69352/g.166270 Transcript_69352/m.166270 type:complete len:238 (-) Transcript_69352:302-1015(-)